MNIFFFLGGTFLAIAFMGQLLEKWKIPWIFAALFLGLVLSLIPYQGITDIKDSEVFVFLGNLGMYFMLFLIGYELDVKKLRQLGSFIVRSTFFIIFFEAIFGGTFIHYVFGYSWLLSMIVSLSFATIGEAVLIPILDEFRMIKTKLGQSILGIATFDDTIEIFVIIFVSIMLPILSGDHSLSMSYMTDVFLKPLVALAVLFVFSLLIFKFGELRYEFRHVKIEIAFFLIIAFFFLFLGIAALSTSELGALGAIVAGLVMGNQLSSSRKLLIEKEAKTISYGFFAPIFFLWVGLGTDVRYILGKPLLILGVFCVTYASKILASYLVARKELGKRESIVMGLAIGVRFSTSIVIIKYLFENGLIHKDLYSALVGSTIVFFVVPFLLSYFVRRWKLVPA